MPIHEVDEKAALDRFVQMTEIPGKSGDEKAVATWIADTLKEAGVDASQICFDGAESRTRLAGDCGNLIVNLPGNGTGPRTLLSAHMDTVPICVGAKPIVDGDVVRSSVNTGLGADNRAGCTSIMTAIVERLRRGDENFPPAVVLFTIQEEIGLEGAKALDIEKIGSVDRAFNFDGGTVEKVTYGAIGGERMTIRLTGIPAHAGVAPEKGASAIVMASKAIADLHQRGWHGKIQRDDGTGTSNVGVFEGGQATNVVTPEVMLRAEARSHDAAMRTKIVQEIRSAFEKAAKEVCSEDGQCGEVVFESNVDYEAYRLDENHPSIQMAHKAVKLVGREPFNEIGNGGLDANWLFNHGIEAVTLGCGQREIHTAEEWLCIPDLIDACKIASYLITDGAEA